MMSYIIYQHKTMNQRRYSRRVISATAVSVLSILGSTTLANATNNSVNAASASSQLRAGVRSFELQSRASHDYLRAQPSSTSTTPGVGEGEFSKEGEEEVRLLETENGDRDEGTRIPRRSPIVIDPEKREHPKPPFNKMTPLLTTNEWSPQQPIIPSKHNPLTPFYPDLVTHTCSADNNYPEHYLYDINAYFSRSPQACCELHFNGIDTENCIDHLVYDGTIIQHSDGNIMSDMMKKEEYRVDDTVHSEFGGMLSEGGQGGEGGEVEGGKGGEGGNGGRGQGRGGGQLHCGGMTRHGSTRWSGHWPPRSRHSF